MIRRCGFVLMLLLSLNGGATSTVFQSIQLPPIMNDKGRCLDRCGLYRPRQWQDVADSKLPSYGSYCPR